MKCIPAPKPFIRETLTFSSGGAPASRAQACWDPCRGNTLLSAYHQWYNQAINTIPPYQNNRAQTFLSEPPQTCRKQLCTITSLQSPTHGSHWYLNSVKLQVSSPCVDQRSANRPLPSLGVHALLHLAACLGGLASPSRGHIRVCRVSACSESQSFNNGLTAYPVGFYTAI